MTPMLTTSIAKTPAASGVPNTAAKQALIPHITAIFLSFSSRRSTLPNRSPSAPPSCKAAPSLPTDALTQWLKIVEQKINGAVASVIFSFEEIEEITMFVPRFFSSFVTR